MKYLWQLCLFYNIVRLIAAVKIGISKPDLLTTPTTTTTTTTMRTPNSTTDLTDISGIPNVFTETTAGDILSSSTVEESSTTLLVPTTSTLATTTKPTTTKATVKPKTKPRAPTKIPAKITSTTESLNLKSDNNNDDLANATASETFFSFTTNQFFCACNLLPNECDINCCCDQDCSKDALLIFDCHHQPAHPELKQRLEDFQYQHGLPSCKINDGWLCVFRSNIKVEEEKEPSLIADTSDFYKWSSLMEEALPLDSMADDPQFYKYGATMQLINLDTMDIKNFELPYAFLSARCQIREPIGYLKETRRQCLLTTIAELQEQKHGLLENLKGYKLIKRPLTHIVDTVKIEENLLEIKPKRCELQDDKTKDCTTEENSTELWVDNFYVLEIELIFRHNFTQLLDCELVLKERQIINNTTVENSGNEYWLIYSVKFEYYDERKKKESKLGHTSSQELAISGALGYLQGQPLIMAHYIAFNSSLEMHDDNRVLSYFHPNATKLRSEHSLVLMSQHHELCALEMTQRHFVNYGINVLKQCKVRLENTTDLTKNPNERNFTAICEALQNQAMQYLLTVDQQQEIWISQLGKPQNNTEEYWVPLQWKNFEYPPVMGIYNVLFQSFTCRNILLNVQYEFQVGSFMEQGVAHQNLLKQATLTSGRRHDLEFSLDETLELPLSVSVMFYDYANSVGKKQLHSGAMEFGFDSGKIVYLCAFIALGFKFA